MVLAGAEMLTASHYVVTALMGVKGPALMESPFLSTSLGEFWSKRWNPATSVLVFRTFFFEPLSRRGAVMALCAVFFASAVAHVLLPYMATGKWLISLACGAFFLVQPVLIGVERWLGVRRWSTAAARVWTLGALAICAPLFVEPLLQMIEPTWGAEEEWVAPALWVLVVVLGMSVFFAGGAMASTSVSRRDGLVQRNVT